MAGPLRIRPVLLGTVIVLALLLGALYAGQRALMYFPTRMSEHDALRAAAALGAIPWRESGGELRGWRLANPPSRPRATVLVLHGNAGSALDRIHYARILAPLGVEVALLEYPGYGPRPGRPSLGTLATAAAEAADALAREDRPLWLLGESLGSGVVGRVVAARPGAIRGLLLVTPFADVGTVARRHFPFIPAWFVRDRFQPARDLAAFTRPAIVVLAGRDEVVGAEESRRLFAALPGPKQLVEQPAATHNEIDLSSSSFWVQAVQYLERN